MRAGIIDKLFAISCHRLQYFLVGRTRILENVTEHSGRICDVENWAVF